MTEVRLKDKQWQKIKHFLAENPRVYVGQEWGVSPFCRGGVVADA